MISTGWVWMFPDLGFLFVRITIIIPNLDKFVFSATAWIVYLSFAYRFIRDWFVSEGVRKQLIFEKLMMELTLLKTQANQHFLKSISGAASSAEARTKQSKRCTVFCPF